MRMKIKKIRKKRNPGWYFLLPEFLGVSVFGLIPFADVVRRSFFQTVDGSFVGISNYVQVIKNDAFNLAAKNTLRFVVTCIPCLLLLSLILAMLLQQVLILAEKKKKHRDVTMEQFYRGSAAALKSMYLLPMAIPAASVVVLWKILFDSHGFVNSAIHALSGMSGIGQILNVLSVQEVDGAGKWKKFFYITLPNLRPVAFTVVILSVLNSFKAFREVYMAAGSYPQENIYLLQHVFNNWFQTLSVDKMAAASVMLAFVIAVFVLLLERSWEREG